MKCDYEGCEREAVSGGNTIIDVQGNDYSVDLCAFHLKKLVPEAELKDCGVDPTKVGGFQ